MSGTTFLLTIYLYAGPLGILTVGLVMASLLFREAHAALLRGGGLFDGTSCAEPAAADHQTPLGESRT